MNMAGVNWNDAQNLLDMNTDQFKQTYEENGQLKKFNMEEVTFTNKYDKK